MHILQVTSAYYPQLQFGGPPLQIHALSRGLSSRGHHVDVVTLDANVPARSENVLVEGIPVQYLPWIGDGNRQVPRRPGLLEAAVRRAEIVHCYGLYNLLSPATAFFARRHGKPFLVEPMGMAVVRTGHRFLKNLYHRTFTAYLVRHAARVIAGSPPEAEELASLAGPDRVVLRPLGVDLADFTSPLPSGIFRRTLGIGIDEKIVLYLGRISPIKNLEMLVNAFCKAQLQDTRLVLAGPMMEAKYANDLRSLISHHGVAGQVLLPGPLYGQEKLSALADADLFVLPSLAESFGLVAVEAVAAGVPVLLTDTCGVASKIHRRAGLAVPVDERALTTGLKNMVTDSEQLASLTSRRHEVLAELSWTEPLDLTERLYQAILHALPSAPIAVHSNP